jgi:hypothetical protein
VVVVVVAAVVALVFVHFILAVAAVPKRAPNVPCMRTLSTALDRKRKFHAGRRHLAAIPPC